MFLAIGAILDIVWTAIFTEPSEVIRIIEYSGQNYHRFRWFPAT